MASFRKRGPYQYQATVRRTGYPVQIKTFTEKREAEAWALDVESQMVRGLFVCRAECEKTTLKQLLLRYEKEVTPSHKGRESESRRLLSLSRHALAERFLDTLGVRDFAAYRDARLKVRKPATVVREMALFARVFEVARREWGIAVSNPLAELSRPIVRNERTRRLSQTEEDALMVELEGQERGDHGCLEPGGVRNVWIKPIVQMALETACRRSELLAFQWSNTDLERKVVMLPDTKNTYPREVPLSKKAADILKNLPRTGEDRVFPTTADAVKKSYSRAVKRAGINDYIGAVTLNPERDCIVKQYSVDNDIQQMAA